LFSSPSFLGFDTRGVFGGFFGLLASLLLGESLFLLSGLVLLLLRVLGLLGLFLLGLFGLLIEFLDQLLLAFLGNLLLVRWQDSLFKHASGEYLKHAATFLHPLLFGHLILFILILLILAILIVFVFVLFLFVFVLFERRVVVRSGVWAVGMSVAPGVVLSGVFLPCHSTFRELFHHLDESLAVVFEKVIRHGENAALDL
jgi:hypothetical protein